MATPINFHRSVSFRDADFELVHWGSMIAGILACLNLKTRNQNQDKPKTMANGHGGPRPNSGLACLNLKTRNQNQDKPKTMANGHSGPRPNSGRPKGATAARAANVPKQAKEDIRECARRYGPKALAVLLKVAEKSQSDSARVAAANALLDRGYGRPHQADPSPDPKLIEGIVIEPFHKTNGSGSAEPVKLKDWREEP